MIVVMSENRVDRLMKKRNEIAQKINEKVSNDVREYRENRSVLKRKPRSFEEILY
ncbi:MAG: hypothetical protein ACR2IS_06580 [Nitrososphaeraceae archaeon]